MLGQNVKVSILMPVYNEQEYIEEPIESLSKQTYRNIEIIVVDDGSTDTTPLILEGLAKKYSSILKVYRIEHSSPARAKNIGIQNATGQLIMLWDANDFILDEKYLEKIVKAYISQHSSPDLINMRMLLTPLKKTRLSILICSRLFKSKLKMDKRNSLCRSFAYSGIQLYVS